MTANTTKCPIKMRKRHQDWDAFDSLPREVRDALNYAAFKYSAARCPAHLGKALAARIIETDAKQVTAAYAEREVDELLKGLGL